MISKIVRDAIHARLADGQMGFNARMAEAAAAHGCESFSIHFAAGSQNYFQGFLTPDQVEASSLLRYPLMTLYSAGSENRNLQKFALFSGPVSMGIDVHLSWPTSRALSDFESLGDAVEAAMVNTFHAGDWVADYPAGFVYNGDLALSRRPLEFAGEHWRQTLAFRLTTEMHL